MVQGLEGGCSLITVFYPIRQSLRAPCTWYAIFFALISHSSFIFPSFSSLSPSSPSPVLVPGLIPPPAPPAHESRTTLPPSTLPRDASSLPHPSPSPSLAANGVEAVSATNGSAQKEQIGGVQNRKDADEEDDIFADVGKDYVPTGLLKSNEEEGG